MVFFYSVASVYFSNGSAVDVAKIPGGTTYRQIMREAYLPKGHGASYDTALHHNQLGSGLRDSQALIHPQLLRDYLPPWLGGKRPRTLVPMLRALKAAVESYLETTISNADIVVPFPITDSFHESVHSACSSISLSMGAFDLPIAGIFAAPMYGIGKKPCLDDDDPQPQLILTIEYSRAALTAFIILEECTIFERRRVLHDTNLGLDQLRGDPGSGSTREKLEASLGEFICLPMNDGGNGEKLRYINNLVLLGESAGDPQLHDVLKKIIGERYGRLMATVDNSGLGVIDPLFVGARGIAYYSWVRQDMDENDGPEQRVDRVDLNESSGADDSLC
jgi:hypothetical protein